MRNITITESEDGRTIELGLPKIHFALIVTGIGIIDVMALYLFRKQYQEYPAPELFITYVLVSLLIEIIFFGWKLLRYFKEKISITIDGAYLHYKISSVFGKEETKSMALDEILTVRYDEATMGGSGAYFQLNGISSLMPNIMNVLIIGAKNIVHVHAKENLAKSDVDIIQAFIKKHHNY